MKRGGLNGPELPRNSEVASGSGGVAAISRLAPALLIGSPQAEAAVLVADAAVLVVDASIG
eukprot:49838-Prorocentrum_minimum.AAC.1